MDKIIVYRISVILLIIAIVTSFAIFRVDGQSMEPTLDDQQYILMCRWCAVYKNDIIIFNNPNNELSVKRVVANANDDITIVDGYITINGIKSSIPNSEKISKTNNDGDYFVVGDNYLNSFDSRNYGWISSEQIKGKVIIK